MKKQSNKLKLIPNKKFVEDVVKAINPTSKVYLIMAILKKAGYVDIEAFNKAIVRAERFLHKLGRDLNEPYALPMDEIDKNIGKIPGHIRDKIFLKSLIEQAGEIFDASRKIQTKAT